MIHGIKQAYMDPNLHIPAKAQHSPEGNLLWERMCKRTTTSSSHHSFSKLSGQTISESMQHWDDPELNIINVQ